MTMPGRSSPHLRSVSSRVRRARAGDRRPRRETRAARRSLPAGPRAARSGGKISFELASRGGYVRTVTGTVAYLDEQTETYMVLADSELLRVPLRDTTARHEVQATDEIDRSPDRDAEGLGTG